MGVEDFYGKWLMNVFRKYPSVKKSIQQLPAAYSVSIDMNGLIHAITPEVYAYGNIPDEKKAQRKEEIKNLIHKIRKETIIEEFALTLKKEKRKFEGTECEWFEFAEQLYQKTDPDPSLLVKAEIKTKEKIEDILFREFSEKLALKIEELCSSFKTEHILNLAVDGPAPWAKIQQQRYRRFKSAKLNLDTAGKLTEDFYFFNASACITPGTEFMQKLDSFLTGWVENRSRGYLKHSPKIVRYSSFKIPGEGEHKIFADYRDKIIDSGDSEKINVLIGKDADLIILSCISPLSNIVINREKYYDNIIIDELKKVILEEMNFEDGNEKICLQDFVVITFFVGNDFLPRIYQFKNVKASLEYFLKLYRLNKIRLTSESSEIIWENFYDFIYRINKKSTEFYYSILDEEWEYPPKILKMSMTDEGLNTNFFSQLWYLNALKPRTDVGNEIYDAMFNSPETDPDDIRDMCNCYLKGLQWILRYYTSNEARRDYYYPYLYAPLLKDILDTISYNIRKQILIDNDLVSIKSIYTLRGVKTLDIPAQIPQQLAVTIPPPFNKEILEPKLYNYVDSRGLLSDLVPFEFEEELDTISLGKEHQGVIFLPVCEPERISRTIDNRKLSRNMKDMMSSQNIVSSQITPKMYNRNYTGRGGGRGRGDNRGRGRGEGRGRGGGRGNEMVLTTPEKPVQKVYEIIIKE